MRGHHLERVNSVKYLGVTISSNGSWNEHISNVAAKGHQTLTFLQRNLGSCPTSTKVLSYKSLVRSRIEYATNIWDPHTKANIDKLEMIQRKGARYVCRDFRQRSSVSDMLLRLQWESLQARHKADKLVMLYKMVHGLVDLSTTQFMLIPSPIHQYCFIQPHTRTDCYKHSFIPSAVRLWNGLPPSVIQMPTLNTFRAAMQPLIYQQH